MEGGDGMEYETILSLADSMKLDVREKPLLSNDGLTYGRRIAIRKSIPTSVEKACVLSEELAHTILSVGDITDYSDQNNWKQEMKARTAGYMLMVTPDGLISAYESGCRNRYEIASHLGVTEAYLEDAIERYRQKYGNYQRYGDYVILFEPCLGIIKFN
jgi:hypothetical protein